MAKIIKFGSIGFALMALLLIAEAKSFGESTDRIFGGKIASPGQFPYQVSVRGPKFGYAWHFCGGVLISNQFVLTTANCTQGFYSNPANVTVVVGTHTMDPLDSGTSYDVSRITNHPLFVRNTMSNDISVIKTTQKVEFTELVQPVRLPTSDVVNGAAATISGWGRFNNDPYEYWATQLHFHHTNVMARAQCIERLGTDRIHENTVCTTHPADQGVCRGDFGGPLVQGVGTTNVLIGLSSWTEECGGGFPDVYANVFSHLQFIQETMSK